MTGNGCSSSVGTPPVQRVVLCLTSRLLADKLRSFDENLPREALKLYPSSAPCPTKGCCPERAFTTMVSDIRVTCPNNDLALRAAGTLRSRSQARQASFRSHLQPSVSFQQNIRAQISCRWGRSLTDYCSKSKLYRLMWVKQDQIFPGFRSDVIRLL